jgi:uncharacterized metal-binding protein YceD (DUF177 family)
MYHAVNLAVIGADGDGTEYVFKANSDQRSALAGRFGCVEIIKFEVRAKIVPLPKEGHYSAIGRITGSVVQNCVVSLAPVVTELDQELNLALIPESEGLDAQTDVDEEDVEFYSANMIDLGEIGAVEMALALDPYPRAPGVSVTDLGPGGDDKAYEVHEEGHIGGNRPFEALAAIKKKV